MTILKDKDIREPLFEYLEEKYGKIRILEEKTMGRSRADIIMVHDHWLCGIEIKSDVDSYMRLKRQVKDYNQFFDFNIVVVGTRHVYHIEEHVPSWWGIITVEMEGDKVDFYTLREMSPNPKDIVAKKLTFLWRPELVSIQEKNQMPKYREKSKRFVVNKILEKVDAELLHQQISEELFERDYTLIAEQIQAYRKQYKK